MVDSSISSPAAASAVWTTFGRPRARDGGDVGRAAYMAIMLVMGWTLQMFPATPKLAPIYNASITCALGFPLLMIFPRSRSIC